MSSPAEPPPYEDKETEEEFAVAALAHHPPAPPHELFDISTTVDPSHIISLIRKLLPLKNGDESLGYEAHNPPIGELKVKNKENSTAASFENGEAQPCAGKKSEGIETAENLSEVDVPAGVMDEGLHYQQNHHDGSVEEAAWEEYGCTLWDLAANETHAELMVQNLILEVLLANLMASYSPRIKEISLGIIGNLACHEVTRRQIASKVGLIEIIVQQLFLEDAPCLCEAFRLMTLCFQAGDGVFWTEALKSEHILSRILWIVENTLNIQLIEKSVGLLLAVLGSQKGITTVLLPPLVKLGLPNLLINLLAFEMSKLTLERIPERYSVLDVLLQAIEALSVIDEFSPQISLNKELFKLLCDLIKLPDKSEVSSSCVTAAVLIANVLADSADLVSEISQDVCFFQALFSIFPFASDDIEAKSALWSIVLRLLISVEETKTSALSLHHYVSILVSNSDLIEDELLDDRFDNSNEEFESLTKYDAKSNAKATALKRIFHILSQWKLLKPHDSKTGSLEQNYVSEGDVNKLLNCCSKFL